jgi:O-antigen/teichoic acid export membrane protein
MALAPVSSKKRIALNAFTSSMQVLLAGFVYFLLYRYLLNTLGSKELGVWSLVLSTASLATMANFGITAGLVKFIAEYDAKSNRESVNRLIFTAFTTVTAFFGVLIILLYFILNQLLAKIVEPSYVSIARQMLPFSLGTLFINELGGIFTSVLDGFQKNYKRNILYILSSFIFLGGSYLLVPKYHLLGVAYAQIAQSAFVAISAFILASGLFDAKIFTRMSWDKTIFKHIFSYGTKFQLISICQMMYEPTTKALLSKFGGLSILGYYEMASRLVSQVRALIVNANQVVVPVIANAAVTNKTSIGKIYAGSMSIVLFITVPLMTGLIFFAAPVSAVWIGHVEPAFVFSVSVLSVGMFFNIMGTPAYYGFLGEGKLNLILAMHALIAVINLVCGYFLGKAFPGYGAIIGWGIALVIGSSKILLSYQKHHALSFRSFFVWKDYLLLFAGAALTISSFIFFKMLYKGSSHNFIQLSIIEAVLFLILFLPLLIVNKNSKMVFSFIQGFIKRGRQ